jgi:hypothetical protein
MADTVYTSFTKDIGTGIIDLDTDDIWVMLATNTYVPSTAHAKRSDITNEAAGTGYTAGGMDAGVVTATTVGTKTQYDCPDPSWAGSSISARYAIFYKKTGGAASTDPLIVCLDLTGSAVNLTSSAGPFTVIIGAAGFVTIGN